MPRQHHKTTDESQGVKSRVAFSEIKVGQHYRSLRSSPRRAIKIQSLDISFGDCGTLRQVCGSNEYLAKADNGIVMVKFNIILIA